MAKKNRYEMKNKIDKKESDFQKLDAKLKEARISAGLEEENSEENKKNNSAFGQAYKMGIELVAGVIVGLVLGLTLDDLFDTKPFFLVLFLFLGFGAGVRNVYKDVMKMQTNETDLTNHAQEGLKADTKQDKRPHRES